jgi:3-oxoacyl-[acyl-carrier protein] reductase
MELGLKGRVAMIAGATQGLGRATAVAFAREGAHLALCARNAEVLEELAGHLREEHNVQVHAAPLDVKDSDAIKAFVKDTARKFDRIDICVPNAGGPPAKSFLQTTLEDWDTSFQLNLKSAVVFAQTVIPYMQRRGWGRIVTISSITVKQPQPQLILSNAIRTGILGLVRSLAEEFAKDGILVNNVGPGYTATDRLKELSVRMAQTSGRSESEIEKTWTDQIPLGRLGKPEELADAVVWLASERASFITGQTILVDGGMYKGL